MQKRRCTTPSDSRDFFQLQEELTLLDFRRSQFFFSQLQEETFCLRTLGADVAASFVATASRRSVEWR
jgi:hypothetical protein